MAPALTDAHGVPLGGPAEGVAAYDRALDRLLRFHPDVLTAADELTTVHPNTAMGHALVAYLNLMGTNPADLPGAAAAAAAL
ncbi:MAG: hypothetical protein OEW29_05365, partial [Acidimicrobiia bacterium]|nr:hypothetical protein [Acidimicrobiia bacterium]